MRETRSSLGEFFVSVDDHNLVGRVACLGRQRFDAPLESLRAAMATPNDDLNSSRFQQLAPDTERVSMPVHSHVGWLAATLQVTFNCKP